MEKSGTLSILEKSSRRNFVFVVLNDFSLIAFANAIEPLRLANRMAGKELYTWTVSSSNTGSEVKCSNYSVIKVSDNLPEIKREDTIIVCGGTNIRDNTTKYLLSWFKSFLIKINRSSTTISLFKKIKIIVKIIIEKKKIILFLIFEH